MLTPKIKYSCLKASYLFFNTTKTEESERYIALPEETMEMLRAYRKWYIKTSTEFGSRWNNTGFLFFQERSGYEGMPMNPDSVNIWLRSFSKRHGLGHINPHAFRHTMASLLLHGNMDIGAISKRLSHAKITTTLDIYSHIMKESDQESAETICDYQVDRIFSEKISVSTQNASQFAKDRPQLRAMLDYVREGIEIAKAQGKYTGRKPIEIDWTRFDQLYGEWKSKSITGRDFMRRMGLSANTFYRRVREYEAEHGIAEPTSA